MVDVESNGLDYFRGSKLLEIVGVVVDTETLEPLDDKVFHAVVHYTEDEARELFNAAVPFVQEMHDRTDLWNRLSTDEAEYIETIDIELQKYLALYDSPNRMSIGGNSVRLDANFMEEFLPISYSYLRYQLLDVTSIGKAARHWFGIEPFRWSDETAADAHNPLTDVKQSIAELRYYRDQITIGQVARRAATMNILNEDAAIGFARTWLLATGSMTQQQVDKYAPALARDVLKAALS